MSAHAILLEMLFVPSLLTNSQKRRRREYRQARKEQFKRPEHNFSMYEGRTRGKRMKYTYSDEEDEMYSDTTGSRRSTRNTGTHTPAEPAAPTVTQSGRQVKSRVGGAYGESMLSGTHNTNANHNDVEMEDTEEASASRPRRAAAPGRGSTWASKGKHIEGYNSVDEMDDDEEDDASEQDYGDDEEDDDQISLVSDKDEPDDDTDEDEDMEGEDEAKKSLIVKLTVKTPTPEKKKATIKLRLSPQPNAASDVESTAEDAVRPESTMEVDGNEQPRKSVQVLENCTPKAIPISSKLVSNPHSPSLTFRGSPEKPSTLPPSINVGFGGS
jgi:hypothetical protein